MTERPTASAGDGWDADVLSSDTQAPGATETRSVTARPLGSRPDETDAAAFDPAWTGSDEPEVEALVVGIAAIRADIAGTVDELGQRLEPSAIAEEAKDRVREATIGNIESKVNEMTTAASGFANDTRRTAQQVGGGLIETIRQNPIPAAMAGIGIGWLLMNRQSANRSITDGSWSGEDRWLSGGAYGRREPAGSSIRRTASQLGNSVGDAAGDARRSASEAASTVGETAGHAATTVSRTATDVMGDAQRAIESNPLAFGAIAVAVGAAVGMALPSTAAERRVMGQTGAQLIDKAADAVERPLQQMETSASR